MNPPAPAGLYIYGTEVGLNELRYSPDCDTNWTRSDNYYAGGCIVSCFHQLEQSIAWKDSSGSCYFRSNGRYGNDTPYWTNEQYIPGPAQAYTQIIDSDWDFSTGGLATQSGFGTPCGEVS